MMINGATEIATIALRHEFGELCPILCADETRAKEKKDRCDCDLSPGICCSELIDSWAVSAALASASSGEAVSPKSRPTGGKTRSDLHWQLLF